MNNGALIGFGYWGKTLAKTLKQIKPSLDLYVFDKSVKARKSAVKNGFTVYASLKDILESQEISFLVIATPPSTHYSLVKKGLNSNKNVLVEKPFGWHTENKESLFHLAKQKNKVLMVDYTYLYSPGFQKLRDNLKKSKITSYESLRLNSELARTDTNVVNDLIIHDLSMLLEIIPSKPLYCVSHSINQKYKIAQQAFILIYGKNWQASICGSRIWVNKIRTVIVRSTKKTLCFEEKTSKTFLSVLQSGNYKQLKIQNKTSLEFMFEEFFKRIQQQSWSNDFLRYKKISALLHAINKSMIERTNIKIQWNIEYEK